MKTATLNINKCYDCPCLLYYPESGCRVYEPAHYACSLNPILTQDPYKHTNAKLIAKDDKWDGEIPNWCEIDKKTITYDGWERG